MTGPEPHDQTSPRRSARAAAEGALGRAPKAAGPAMEPEPGRPASRPVPGRRASWEPLDEPETRPQPQPQAETQSPQPLSDTGATLVRHARARRARWIGVAFAGIAAGALVFGGVAAVTTAMTGPVVSDSMGLRLMEQAATQAPASASPSASPPVSTPPPPPAVLPEPTVAPAPAAVDLCAIPAVAAALAAGDDSGAIAAAGGAPAFRDAVSSGLASCVALDDPSHVWVVANKLRPYAPIDYEPAAVVAPANVRTIEAGRLRTDAAAALSTLVAAAIAEGQGEIALDSGYRSYATQQTNYANGGPDVDASVARPGFSEHQSGLAADVVACGSGCGSLDDLAATPQGAWIAANSWRFGWIVRYEAGRTDVTGYIPEPWHLRYIGTELATAYHDGGWHTLEEFFGLAPAPDYAG